MSLKRYVVQLWLLGFYDASKAPNQLYNASQPSKRKPMTSGDFQVYLV